MLITFGAYAQNDSILPNVFAEYVIQDEFINPDVNIWVSLIRFDKSDIFTGEETGEDTILVNAYDPVYGLYLPIAYVALDGYRAYIKRYEPDMGYEHFNYYFGDDWELLYDFSLNVGDTAGTLYGWDPDDPTTPPLIVLQVDTMYVQGEPRKVLKLGWPPNHIEDTWIQGMGSIMHPIAPKLYYFEVSRILCGAAMVYGGPSPVDSNYYSVSSCSISPVRDVGHSNEVRIFPNPTKEHFTVSMEGMRRAVLVIHDQTGREVYRTSLLNEESQIPTNGFSPGIYFITIRNENAMAVRKIVIE